MKLVCLTYFLQQFFISTYREREVYSIYNNNKNQDQDDGFINSKKQQVEVQYPKWSFYVLVPLHKLLLTGFLF